MPAYELNMWTGMHLAYELIKWDPMHPAYDLKMWAQPIAVPRK